MGLWRSAINASRNTAVVPRTRSLKPAASSLQTSALQPRLLTSTSKSQNEPEPRHPALPKHVRLHDDQRASRTALHADGLQEQQQEESQEPTPTKLDDTLQSSSIELQTNKLRQRQGKARLERSRERGEIVNKEHALHRTRLGDDEYTRYSALQDEWVAELDACTSSRAFYKLAAQIYSSKLLATERENPDMPLIQNEKLFLAVFSRPTTGGEDLRHVSSPEMDLKDHCLSVHLRACVREVGLRRFSSSFFILMTDSPLDDAPIPRSVKLLADMMLHLFLTHAKTKVKPIGEDFLSKLDIADMFLQLLRRLSYAGWSEDVVKCFHALRANKVPMEIRHYQYALIAMSNVSKKEVMKLEEERQTKKRKRHRLYGDKPITYVSPNQILHLKACMDEDGVDIDDRFLATVVLVLASPLKQPSRQLVPKERLDAALDIVRSIGRQALSASEDRGTVSPRIQQSRLFSALFNVELASLGMMLATKTRSLVSSNTRGDHSNKVASLSKALNPASLSALDRAAAQVRLSDLNKDFAGALSRLDSLLHWDLGACRSAAERRDVLLKQRGAVIYLFSSGFVHRTFDRKRDACLQVLKLVVEHPRFDQTWAHIQMPANPSPFITPEICNPRFTLARLWKRWFRAWSIDVVSYQTAIGPASETTGEGFPAHAPFSKPLLHTTYAGQNPWKTLSRGSILLTHTLNSLDILVEGRKGDREPSEKLRENMFNVIFQERTCLDTVIRITLRGGRNTIHPEQNEEFHSVKARIEHILRLLSRVEIKPLIWDRVETSILQNISRMEDCRLSTNEIRTIVDEVRSRRDSAAKARDHDVLRREQRLYQLRREKNPDQYPYKEDDDHESASVFVLRNLILNK